jgi:uncharacterized protein (DUF2336 family)
MSAAPDLPLSLDPLEPGEKARRAMRLTITQRLAEVVTWPATRIAPHERELAGDILVGLLRTAPLELRRRCAERIARLEEAPKVVLRYLAADEITVAAPLLTDGLGLSASDLIDTVQAAGVAHARVLATRRGLIDTVGDALIKTGAPPVLEALLRNASAKISFQGMDKLVRISRDLPTLLPLLVRREELTPTQGFTLFWWAESPIRHTILRRFAVDRGTLIPELSDLFARASADAALDPEARQALQFIERRQRSRGHASRFETLEQAVAIFSTAPLDEEAIEDIAVLTAIRPAVAERILKDQSGEPVAVLAKAVGLKREPFSQLLDAVARTAKVPWEREVAHFTYDILATAKAQTVLRYWNWVVAFSEDVDRLSSVDEAASDVEAYGQDWRIAAMLAGR